MQVTVIAERIKQARQEAGISTEALARQLDVSVRTVAGWQAGRSEPSYARLAEVAAALGKPLAWFFSENGDQDGAA